MTLGRRLLTALSAVLLLMLLGLPAFAQQPFEQIGAGETLADSLTVEEPLQVYAFTANAGTTYTITVTSTTPDLLQVDVVDDEAQSVVTDSVPGDSGNALTVQGGAANSTFYVLISSPLAAVGGTVDYSVSLSVPNANPFAAQATPTTAPAVPTDAAALPTDAAAAPAVDGQLVTSAGFSISLTWTGQADLDLEIRDPVGGSLYWETPSVNSGGTMSANVNQGCANVNADTPSETATWSPGGIPTGSYEVLVYYQQPCAGNVPVSVVINSTLDGAPLPVISGVVNPSEVLVSRIVVNADGTTNVLEIGGVVALDSIPYTFVDVQAAAQPIEREVNIEGFVRNDSQFASYSFEGFANELISLNAFATSGSLDTFIALYDSTGNVIAFNDDIGGGVTDSLIDGVLLPANGTYYAMVTRYGKAQGGTEGGFSLLLTQQTVNLSAEFASLPEGSLEVLLIWNTAADLQLLVRDAAGDSVFDDIPRISSGGTLAALGNVNCRVSEGTPFSYIYWPPERQPRVGTYEIEVWFQNECSDINPVTFNLYVTLNGRQVLRATDTPLFNDRFLTSFTLNPDGTVTPSEAGIIRGLDTLNYQPEVSTAQAMAAGVPINGTITQANKFDVYTYEGLAGGSITLTMNATSGTLDTTLYLISPSGVLVAENDDAVPGENTNSLIADFTLPEDGQYIIISTHYGALFGGTTGTYSLTLTELN